MNMFSTVLINFLFLGLLSYGNGEDNQRITDFQAFTVASKETDGYRDFRRSTEYYDIPVMVLGLGKPWKGGDMTSYGGGYKINLLREALKPLKDQRKIIMFTDSYDVLYLGNVKTIVDKFKTFEAEILFSAEAYCWPDSNLKKNYPEASGYPYLNSGGFIGYADSIYKLLSTQEIEDVEDDQLYYTLLYLNSTIRNELKLKLDHKAEIFQNLFGVIGDVTLKQHEDDTYYLINERYNTVPNILHGNGLSKVELRSFANYLAGNWSPKHGCRSCSQMELNWEEIPMNKYPIVLIAVFIENPTPFLEEFLSKIVKQNYPKRKIHLFIRNAVPFHKDMVHDFVSEYEGKYHAIKLIPDDDKSDAIAIRELAMDYCVMKKCDVYLNLESDAHMDNAELLTWLIGQNRSIIAPMLSRPYKAWSNFWASLDKHGYYRRSFDYMDIVNRIKSGLWNVPFISGCYLIKGDIIKSAKLRPSYSYKNLDYDMAFSNDMRDKGIYMYVDNRKEFGHLLDLEGFNTSRTNPEVYQLFYNRWDWENRYIHEDFKDSFNLDYIPEQPCPDVYWFPIVSPRFCKEFIEIMESFGRWSDGSHNDTRLKGSYEAVPTRDIHMNQVGLDEQWLEFLRLYVSPLQELVFIGYVHDRPRSLMNFVVRYRPDEQPSLRPHHDSSTFTINIALNSPKIDYQGGGCRFIRYDCSVTDMRLGWMLIHPGRLTHYHEGLSVTNGTRYIMISFVDP